MRYATANKPSSEQCFPHSLKGLLKKNRSFSITMCVKIHFWSNIFTFGIPFYNNIITDAVSKSARRENIPSLGIIVQLM